MIAALIAPFYEPLRLAEDLIVLDIVSRGRVDLIIGAGYVHEEFDLYGIGMSERPRRVTEAVHTLKAAFSGDPFEFRGRTVQLTPSPFRPGGPSIILGGSSEAAARRAARIGDGFIPTTPEVWEPYRDEVQKLGGPIRGRPRSGLTSVVAFAEDAEEGWEQMAPFFLHEMNAYGRLAGPGRPGQSLPDGEGRRRTPCDRQLSGADPRRVRRRAGPDARPLCRPSPDVRRDSPGAGVVESAPVRTRGAASALVRRGRRSRWRIGRPDRRPSTLEDADAGGLVALAPLAPSASG